jgi:hypothetical protein
MKANLTSNKNKKGEKPIANHSGAPAFSGGRRGIESMHCHCAYTKAVHTIQSKANYL